MTDLTPQKIKELAALMATAPPATAARLMAMFERMKVKGSQVIPSAGLIAAMRDAGMTSASTLSSGGVRLPSFDRLFFEPFENLFENGPMEKMLPGSLPRAGLGEVWRLIASQFAREDVADTEALATAAILGGDMDLARDLAMKLRSRLLICLEGLTNEAIASVAQSPEAKAILLRLVPLLVAEACGREIWAIAFGSKGELSEPGVAALSANVRLLEIDNGDAACELVLLTMSTLPRPSEALRVLNKVSIGVDDRRLDISQFAVIGRRVLGAARRAADMIEDASLAGNFDGAALAATVDMYNQNLHGLERQANLAPDGPWQREMLSIRKKVGNRLETICQRATQHLEMALPSERIQRQGIRWIQEPKLHLVIDPVRLGSAVQSLAFVTASRLAAPLAGFSAPRDKAAKHAEAYLDNMCDAILNLPHAAPKLPNLSVWIQSVASLVEVCHGVKEAQVFERRAMAMAAAA